MSSLVQYNRVKVPRQLVLEELAVAALDLDGDGVLHLQVGDSEVVPDGGIQLILDEGVQLAGIAVWDGDVELAGEDVRGMVLVLVGRGSGAFLIPEDVAVAENRKITTTSAATVIGVSANQIFIRYSVDDSRWVVPDWSPTAAPPTVHGSTLNPSKGDTAWAQLPEMSVAITPGGSGSIDVSFAGTFYLAPSAPGQHVRGQVRLLVDGVVVPGTTRTVYDLAASIMALVPGARHETVAILPTRVTGLEPFVAVAVTAEWWVDDTGDALVAYEAERSIRAEYA